MADQDFKVSPRDVPRRDGWDEREWEDRERRIHAPGGSVVVTVPIVMPGQGGGRDGYDGRDGRGPDDGRLPGPAILPLTGNESIEIRQQVPTVPWWRRAVISILDLIRQFWPAAWSWSALNAKMDTPTTLLFTVPGRDMVYQLVYSIVCKTADPGASTGTLTLNFSPLDGTAQPITKTCDLNTVGNGSTTITPVLLAAGSGVSFSFIGGGTYGAASYDLIVSAIPMCSDQVGNAPNNLLI